MTLAFLHDTGNFMMFCSENSDFFHLAVSQHIYRSMKFHDLFTTFSRCLAPAVTAPSKNSHFSLRQAHVRNTTFQSDCTRPTVSKEAFDYK